VVLRGGRTPRLRDCLHAGKNRSLAMTTETESSSNRLSPPGTGLIDLPAQAQATGRGIHADVRGQ